MGIFETFTKRLRKREQAGKADIYSYDSLPAPFRRQVVLIWVDAIGVYHEPIPYTSPGISSKLWVKIHGTLCRELGVFGLGGDKNDPFRQCEQYVQEAETNAALDLIEISFRVIDMDVRQISAYERERVGMIQDPDGAIAELNHRFQEHGVGYQFTGGQINRVDSQFLHAEVVLPAIALLRERKFAGPAEEFLRAHEHYRKGRLKEAINEALKAFESTMKAICVEHSWDHPKGATAKSLLDVLLANGLIPSDLATHFAGFRSALEAGLPTVRNRTSGHGQGAEPTAVPPYLVAYALHLAASNIVLLVEADNAT